MSSKTASPRLYSTYPLSSILIYNGLTVAHFALGAFGIVLSFGDWAEGYWLAGIYLLFAFGQMYIIMPLTVCPSCVYYRIEGGRCISALNLLSRRIAYEGRPIDFRKRAKGWLCHNNLYLAALIAPIPLMLLGLILDFSVTLLVVMLVVVGLLAFRFFVLFRYAACVHCEAKQKCPNAAQMGLNK